MRANDYYQSNDEKALPVFFLSKAQYQDNAQDFTVFERHLLTLQQFKGSLGDIGLISNKEGKIQKVYIGQGTGTERDAIVNAVNRLPEGSYVFQSPLSTSALVGWSLAQYRFDRYKKQDKPPRVIVVEPSLLPNVLAEANAVFLVRDLINRPANDLDPEALAHTLADIAKEHGAIFNQWVGDELLQENFPAIHAVGQAAACAPRLLSLTWGDKKNPPITLIGKGVCFDSGGLDIKPAAAMRLMKKDMGGAAQVIGLAQWLMTIQLPIYLQVYIPAVENAISSQSYRPGDVLCMRNGLQVEVDNTDAEGRLVLADAIVKACEEKPELLINFATLTGAARVAVGTEIAAMFTNDDALAQLLSTVSREVYDPVWRMPLYEGYESMLDSTVADLVNAGASPYAGAITAALFLRRFVKEVSWVHFDVMAWNTSSKPGRPEGGEAMGMQTVAQYLLQRYG